MHHKTLVTGFPRIGETRELKKALESYWSGKSSLENLQQVSRHLRAGHWQIQKEKGIDLISCNDFSWYDTMLDTCVMVNAIPKRFRSIDDLVEQYFTMARGSDSIAAMEMTKWFNTNYHYIVPELDEDTPFSLNVEKILREYKEASDLGINPKINVIGPVTFLGLSKSSNGDNPYHHFEKLMPVYQGLLKVLSSLNKDVYVQFEEPIFVKDPSSLQLNLLKTAYEKLSAVAKNVRIIVTSYFDHAMEMTEALADVSVWGIGLDFVHGQENLNSLYFLKNKVVIAGVVDGRNIWLNNLDRSLNLLDQIAQHIVKEQIIISSSCSLLHTPFSLKNEPESLVRKWFSFAVEKVDEIALLSRLFHTETFTEDDTETLEKNRSLIKDREISTLLTDLETQQKLETFQNAERQGEKEERRQQQSKLFGNSKLLTTTIGSFPQTPEIRKLRREYKKGLISKLTYESEIKKYIDDCIEVQEEIGLDVLVHGEPERNDMVEYFGEMLNGFHFTENGWVQSYGSRCVKPPVIYGDVNRPAPMTVKWITYAQSKTQKIMKGMLTGPVTILNWSFVRDDKPRFEVAKQIALALSEEIEDLEKAGIKVIQVDEAAFKEGYPLRSKNIGTYEDWAVKAFKLAVSKIGMKTQIHTHMCYSDFNDIIKTIENLDADVISIETARSGNKLLKIFKDSAYKNQVGPGVYDIHSPRVPSVDEFVQQIQLRMEVLPHQQLWINPDCGLKTRKWEEVKPALTNMVAAARTIRHNLN